MSIIGKLYKPSDNSYSINITEKAGNFNNHCDYLAGTRNKEAKICKILSEPFNCNIKSVFGDKTLQMIIVEYNNTTHTILFSERNIINNYDEQLMG